jgi:transposase
VDLLKQRDLKGQAAQSVKKADCVFGSFYRRLKSRLDKAQATVATAHAIARVVYKMLKYKACPEQSRRVEYDPLSVNEYQKRYEEQQVKYMKKRAAKFGYQLVPA